MRLLFVIDSLSTGGAQRQMVNLALGMHSRGHSVEFFCYAPGDLLAQPLRTAGIPIYTSFKRSRYSLDAIIALRQRMRMKAYDVILSYLTTPNFYAVIARKVAFSSAKLVVSERSFDPPNGVDFKQNIVRSTYRFSDFVITNSRHQRNNLARQYSWMENKVKTIYNGLDTCLFCPPDKDLVDQPLKLLVVSSVAPQKNGLCLIRALAILRTKYNIRPCVSWVGQHVTSIQDRYDYLQQMKKEIETNELIDQWSWLYQRNDIIKLLHQHHALVHPSYGEGLPNAVCEALACGRPVIVSDVLDHPYLVEHGMSGYLFDWKDPASLAASINHLNDLSVEQRRIMGQHGRYFAEQNLALSRLTDEYEQLFLSLVS
jgi:GalNAc-alpha-(1->4)-GalNAc-alpha-(1->3)-diNAcBac-PP-undecaprenol alpha-1,4-N-acetyl-D-galactosaminyltransferase